MLFGMNVANSLLEQLQNFRFPGFPPFPTTTIVRTTRFLNTCMANLTPLSISSPLDQKTKNIRRGQDSFETKVNKRCFKPDYDHKHEFGSEYRDTRATSPFTVHEDCKGKKPLRYPAPLLPFLANQSCENTKTNPPSSRNNPAPAEALFLAGQLVASDLKCKIQPQEPARQSFNSKTAISVTAEPSSSSPLSKSLTKQLMTKIKDKDGYRATAGEFHLSDQEEEADDECGTDSDLETHAGDDDLSYAADLEENDEGYDSMRSRFQNVRIRKRQRDDTEDAVDNNTEDRQGAGPSYSSGDGQQKVLSLPLTEEERARRGKKSRRAPTISAADGDQAAHVP